MSLTARGRTRTSSSFYVGSEMLKAASMALPAALGFGLRGVITGMALFALVRLCVAWPVVLRGERGPLLDRAALRSQLRYALPFGAAVALSIPQTYFHQYVVSAKFDAAAFAVYSVGLFQLPLLDLLYTPTSEVLMVTLGELEREGRREEAARVFRSAVLKLAHAFVPATVAMVALAPQFIATLFTAKYLAAVPIFRVGVTAALLGVLPVDGVLRARDETRHIFASYLVKALVTVPLVLVCVSRFGMMGAVASWLTAEIVGKLALLVCVPRALGVGVRSLLPWSELAWLGLCAALAVAGALAGVAVAGPAARPVVAGFAGGVGYLGAYALALRLLGLRVPFALPWVGRAAAAA
jgi:O-antigen/teichoic acid export membrane protein